LVWNGRISPKRFRSDNKDVLHRRSRPRKSASGRGLEALKPATLALLKRRIFASVCTAVIYAYWANIGDEPSAYAIERTSLLHVLMRGETDREGQALACLAGNPDVGLSAEAV
jgi:hypothetical protein